MQGNRLRPDQLVAEVRRTVFQGVAFGKHQGARYVLQTDDFAELINNESITTQQESKQRWDESLEGKTSPYTSIKGTSIEEALPSITRHNQSTRVDHDSSGL